MYLNFFQKIKNNENIIFIYINLILIFIHYYIFFLKKKGIFNKKYIYLYKTILLLLIIIIIPLLYILYIQNNDNYYYLIYNIIICYKYIITIMFIIYIIILLILLIRFLYLIIKNPYYIFIISFLLLSFIGTFFIIITKSTKNHIHFIDALFMSTSAVCVTGLSVLKTNQEFTYLGKIILLILIEIGGLGIITITSFFVYFFNCKITFKEELYISNLFNSKSLSNLMNLVLNIIFISLIIEIIGSFMIYLSILKINIKHENIIFFCIFHSISAFCNAGFSTITDGLYSPILHKTYILKFIITLLLIIGGIGFNVLLDLIYYINNIINKIKNIILKKKNTFYQLKIFNINTYLSIITNIILLTFGTILYYFFEKNNALIEHKSIIEKYIYAFFLSASVRTAGFQIINIKLLSISGIIITMILMWIGTSPGSVGGGIKTNTFAISILNFISITRGKQYLEIKGKKISYISINQCFAVIILSLIIILLSIFILIELEPKEDKLAICFEVFSAFSTTGLSLGITPNLSNGSKIILIILMLIGRIGLFNIMLGIMNNIKYQYYYKYPEENILIN